ncbi:hybrid sensor histidine kinase/response regulator [Paratractidigestivibacter sp.]|uniref:hybrid sensor histidine kinase/response regulator n=1 Tax=Paratractidigestivibacter sp. TaxID=2847316 RepID=UPI002AC9C72B|nr:ATP-binding protein [Paratractidigestivibacter sp.]
MTQPQTKLRAHAKDSAIFIVVVLVAVLAFAVYTAALTATLAQEVLDNAVEENTSRADAMHAVLNGQLSDEDFTQINTADDMDTELYEELQARLNQIRNMNSIRYFYTAKRNVDGRLVYVVDGFDRESAGSDFRRPGDLIEDEMVPYISQALAGQAVYSQEIIDSDWGHIFTACYPITSNETGEVMGVLCIEADMEGTYTFIASRQQTLVNTGIVAGFIVLGLLGLAFWRIHRIRAREKQDQDAIVEVNKRLQEALTESTEHAEVVSALATMYATILQINLVDHSYATIDSTPLVSSVVGKKGTIDDVVDAVLDTFVTESMRGQMAEFFDVSTVAERMGSSDTIMAEYRDTHGRWLQSRYIAKSRDAAGAVTEVLYCARDFTDEKRLELDLRDQLQKAAEEARRANVSKTSFLRRMSHDIRTPLNGIIGMMHVMDRYEDDPAKQVECKEKILHSADYLLDLVNNVLDLSKLESGAMELEHKPFHLGKMLLASLPVVETNASENGLTFVGGREASHMVHMNLLGSPTHVNRVLMNLAGNAVKYNRPGGTVKVYVDEIASDDNTATYQFHCEDTGLGMSEEFQKHAFEPFSQEGKQTTTSFSGSGLGLSIVEDLVEKMGGSLEFTSKENVGTQFVVTLTFDLDKSAADPVAIPAPATGVDVSGCRALLVEDNALNMEIAHMMLEELGLVVNEAGNGQEALDAFKASELGSIYFIFMDVMMPVMDGLEATRQIRALHRADAATVRIIAMTANAFAEDKQACLNAGMNAHVGKPIELAAVREALATCA